MTAPTTLIEAAERALEYFEERESVDYSDKTERAAGNAEHFEAESLRVALAQAKVRPADNGLALMLALVLEKSLTVENTLERARQHYDHDEGNYNYTLEHNAWCPKVRRDHGPKFCACGYDDMMDDLRAARVECEQIRASLNHALAKLEVAK